MLCDLSLRADFKNKNTFRFVTFNNVDKIARFFYFTFYGVIFMSVTVRIEQLLQSAPVLLFMKGSPDFPQCGFSGQAVQVLDACNAQFAHFNIFEDEEIREALKTYSNWPTYPQLYIKGELIGGCDIMIDLYKKGELAQLLAAAVEA